ncbi:hypothetical protein [Solimonas sp. SE-A11]|uniref:hypothetical protein n=1 Tax=Solimonas sp. SE-A11 TaxID=3054954 RepID=UPI00259CD102|nr:hypothetical protein [Solimonas sp. SE-A11]MDM4770857.1 hypothetical protein [Solimonas sp. SE-A11]
MTSPNSAASAAAPYIGSDLQVGQDVYFVWHHGAIWRGPVLEVRVNPSAPKDPSIKIGTPDAYLYIDACYMGCFQSLEAINAALSCTSSFQPSRAGYVGTIRFKPNSNRSPRDIWWSQPVGSAKLAEELAAMRIRQLVASVTDVRNRAQVVKRGPKGPST